MSIIQTKKYAPTVGNKNVEQIIYFWYIYEKICSAFYISFQVNLTQFFSHKYTKQWRCILS